MRIGEAVRKRILELCDERGITLNKLATICGITQSTLNNIINGRNYCNDKENLRRTQYLGY